MHTHRTASAITAVVAFIIGVFTIVPLPEPPVNPPGGDKLHHLVAFAALTFPYAYRRPRGLLWVFPAAIAYGAAIEIIQPFVNRHGELLDFLADALGAGLGVVIGLLCRLIVLSLQGSG